MIHLVKLCVGAQSVEDLEAWVDAARDMALAAGEPIERLHTTRMMPSRKDEILEGGSLYWVIKGVVAARQRIIDIRPFKDESGIQRCHLVLGGQVVRTRPQPRRAFQGWRYLEADDAPADLGASARSDDMPEDMRRELMALGLI